MIKDAAVFQLSLLMEEMEQQDEGSNKDPFKNREIEQIVDNITFDLQCPVPGIMHDEIKNVTISRLNLLRLPKELGRKIISEKSWWRPEKKPYKRAFDFP